MPQSYVCLHIHLIFSTKDRQPALTDDLRPRLFSYLGGIADARDCRLVAAGGVADHVHLLVSMGKEISVAELVRLLKANSSKWLHESFSQACDFEWQSGYGAFAVSYSNIDQVKRYIAGQAEHHRRQTFREELQAFMERHGMKFDENWMTSTDA